MKIFALGDIHGEKKHIQSAAPLMEEADVVAIAGDIARSGNRENAEEILSLIEGYNGNIIAVHGNWDGREVIDLLEERGYSLHGRGKVVNGIGFFGVGGSGTTPMKTASEYSEEEIYGFLSAGFDQIKGAERAILLSHAPPKKVRDRTFLGIRAGSASVKRFIEEQEVLLSIVGHVHEASGIERFNSCTVVNSGSFKRGKYSSIEIGESLFVEQGKVK